MVPPCAPSKHLFAKLADTHESANNAQGLVLPVVEVVP
jgi:hypothetical protein